MRPLELKPDDLPKEQLPQYRVIRQRIAARTTGIHVSALPPELESLASLADGDGYLSKHQIPEKNQVRDENDALVPLTRDEAWEFADRHAEEMERELLSGRTGKIAAFFTTREQGIFANFGWPTLYFSGFFHDYLEHTGEAGRALSSRGSSVGPTSGIRIGPVLIAWDAATAAGLTALRHFARGAPMGDRTVVTDVVSTGVYEGASAYASAKLGVLAGAKAMIATATLPIPGAPAAAFATGFLIGTIAAVSGKTLVNDVKNIVVDNACRRDRGSTKASVPITENIAR